VNNVPRSQTSPGGHGLGKDFFSFGPIFRRDGPQEIFHHGFGLGLSANIRPSVFQGLPMRFKS